jgi:pimeloyl-ACP methyl ester carboxylesterase
MRAPLKETIPDIESAELALSGLADRGLLTTRRLADFQDATGLADLSWRVTWNRSALTEAGGDFRSLMRRTQGFVVFMHGWCASGSVWKHLPDLTCAANPRLVALTPDLDGFGRSPFLTEVPALEQCHPSAVMQTVIDWIELLGLRSSARARRRRRVITFVGHSMGGAALFYMAEQGWHENEFARCAVAPALLVQDDVRQDFYHALGVGSWDKKPVDEFKSSLDPRVVLELLGAVDETTRTEHLRVFETTPRGILAQTFYSMGATLGELERADRHNFHVILAHDDRLLKVGKMLGLLDDLGLEPHQVQVVSGDHYLYSASDENRHHLRNREIMLGEILYLHEVCREMQRTSG